MSRELSALDAAERIRNGEVASRDLVAACLDRAESLDARLAAWSALDRDRALARADAMDALRRAGRPTGRLHGVPVAVGDEFESVGPPDSGSLPSFDADAATIGKLDEAGAVVMGKTVSGRCRARNPHNPAHSADGTAAAVAAGHAMLAVSCPADGALAQSASECGVYGFLPSKGIVSRRGYGGGSRSFARVGALGRWLEDVAGLCDALAGFDPGDAAMHTRPKPRMLRGSRSAPPIDPIFAWIEQPGYDRLSSAVREGFEELFETLGDRVERTTAPSSFAEVRRAHDVIHAFEAGRDDGTDERDYRLALSMRDDSEAYFDAFFKDFDAVLAPSSLGEAPFGGDAAEQPECSALWAMAGGPRLSLPLLVGETGLPCGVQLIGAIEEDDRLLRAAAWLERMAMTPDEPGFE